MTYHFDGSLGHSVTTSLLALAHRPKYTEFLLTVQEQGSHLWVFQQSMEQLFEKNRIKLHLQITLTKFPPYVVKRVRLIISSYKFNSFLENLKSIEACYKFCDCTKERNKTDLLSSTSHPPPPPIKYFKRCRVTPCISKYLLTSLDASSGLQRALVVCLREGQGFDWYLLGEGF